MGVEDFGSTSRRRTTRRIAALAVLALVTMGLALVAAPPATASPHGSPGSTAGKPSRAALDEPGTLGGQVSTSDSGDVRGYLEVYAWDPDGEFFGWSTESYVEHTSPAAYSFEVPAGDYYVSFSPSDSRYLTAFSGGVDAPPGALDDPGVVHVAPGGASTADLVAQVDPALRQVTGTTQNAAGDPVPAEVDAYRDLGDGSYEYAASTLAGSDGQWSLDLLPGTYELRFFPDDSDTYENSTLAVTVADADLAVGAVVIPAAGHFTVSGTATGPGGPVAGTTVRLYRLWGTPGSWEDYDWIDEVTADDTGHYEFDGVRGGSRYYTVRAAAHGHVPTYLGGVASVFDAQGFQLTADRPGTDVTMARATTLSGVVSGPGGPAANVDVVLYRWNSDTFESIDDQVTDAAGGYDFDALAPGTYTLYFGAGSTQPPLVSQWLGGGSEPPAGPDAAGTFVVGDTPTDLVRSVTLAAAPAATGTVTDDHGTPLAGASVVGYVWTDGTWEQHATGTTGADGTFRVAVEPGAVMTFRFARGGSTPVYYGGGASLPEAPTAGNSVTVPASGDVSLGTVALAPYQSHLGKVAGQDLPYCRTNVVPANDDGSSQEVPIPFELKYFGAPYSTLYVNNNGNVTFDAPRSDYTPSDLTGAALPIIAPFFADVDTRALGSNVVTYGASPDGSTFCVNWADVGYYGSHDDLLNTFQLLLTKNTAGAGRVAGDFDITFNYDQVQWETGDASGGSGGMGGTPAAVGFSAGTGDPGTFVQLPGSLQHGALLDGGPDALVAHSQNSAQLGRYVFQVRNDGIQTALGNLSGTVVKASNGDPVADAYVEACRTTGTGCGYGYTNGSGAYTFTALHAGTYDLRVWPPSDALFGGGTTATVVAGETTTVPAIELAAPQPPPSGTTITNNGTTPAGVPSVNYAQPLELDVTGCPGVSNPTYTVTLASGQVIRDHLPMTEVTSGHYHASIAPFTPNTGDAVITTTVPLTCGGAPVTFNVYIDPSGIVTDQWGRPIEGATVTLLRSETQGGDFAVVPDGSELMSVSNRHNPSTTDAAGFFQWDVQAGWYEVTAEQTGCGPRTTAPMEVPPERVDLLIDLTCDVAAPTPSSAPTVSGTPQVGEEISPSSATWPGPLQETKLELLRNGDPVDLVDGGYTLLPSDVGATFTARSTGKRPDYTQEGGTGDTVQFTAVTAVGDAVTGALGAAAQATKAPGVTGRPAYGRTLTATTGDWDASGLTFAYQWLRGGKAIPDAVAPTYRVGVADATKQLTVRVTATRSGYADGVATSAPVKVAKLASSVRARLKAPRVAYPAKGQVVVTVKVPGVVSPRGRVSVLEGRKAVGSGTLRPTGKGLLTVNLARLRPGRHVLVVSYAGTATTAGSRARAVTLVVTAARHRVG